MNPVNEESFEQEVAPGKVGDGRLDVGVTKCPLFNLSIFFFLQTMDLRKHWYLFLLHRIKNFLINLGYQYEKC